MPDPKTYPKPDVNSMVSRHGAIALSDDNGHQIAIFFAREIKTIQGNLRRSRILFRASYYDSATFPTPTEGLNETDAVESSSVLLSGGHKAVVQLQQLKRSEVYIALFVVSVDFT